MNFILIVILLIILAIIYLYDFLNTKTNTNMTEKFYSDVDLSQSYEPVNYKKMTQNCNELTYDPSKCYVETVVPENKIVCNKSLSPITNNQIDCNKRKKKLKKNPTLSLKYDFDLLPSFNQSQQKSLNIDNNDIDDIDDIDNKDNNKLYVNNSHDLTTDIRSMNSLENDLISNF